MVSEITNPLSWPVFWFMELLGATLNLLLPEAAQRTVSSLMIGNIFGLFFGPFLCLWLVCTQLLAVPWLLTSVVAVYLVSIWLDTQHLRVPQTDKFRPLGTLERMSAAFFATHFDYFPMTTVFDDGGKLDATKQYLFPVHPHGIHCWALNVLSFTQSDFFKRLPNFKIVGVAATVIFKMPVVRELFLRLHYRDASRKTCSKVLASGSSLFIVTGGEAESLATENGKDKVVLKDRKGFVRLALSYGTPLVPVYGFGIPELYTTFYHPFKGFRKWLSKNFGVAIPLFHGRYFSPLPHQKPVKVLIGAPIEVPKPKTPGEKPDPALVDEYHQKYLDALTALYDKHAPVDILDGKETKRKLTLL